MQDHTVEALNALDHPADIGTIRAAIEHDGEARATAAGAPIRTRRALLLLFDVLVGITRGTLRHDQGAWNEVRTSTATEDAPRCGTFRCLAGWLVHIRYPHARPHEHGTPLSIGGMTVRASSFVVVPGEFSDPIVSYGAAAVAALDIPDSDDYAEGKVYSMFTGNLPLDRLWEYAADRTGGVVTLPAELRGDVRAAVTR